MTEEEQLALELHYALMDADKWRDKYVAASAELARLREATRPRLLTAELPPEDMHEALFWDGVRWEMFDNWESDGWQAEYAAGQLDDLIYWQPLPEPPK